jgi:hypothetical protein
MRKPATVLPSRYLSQDSSAPYDPRRGKNHALAGSIYISGNQEAAIGNLDISVQLEGGMRDHEVHRNRGSGATVPQLTSAVLGQSLAFSCLSPLVFFLEGARRSSFD